MAKIGSPFWGQPTYRPRNKDVARFLEVIRKATEKQSAERALQTATSALEAIIAFIAEKAGLKEVLALLERLHREVIGNEQPG